MKYKIANSKNADTRSAQTKTKKALHIDTLKHIKDVQSVMSLVAIKIQKQGIEHDHTKIKYLDEFYSDWKGDSKEFTNKKWYQKHITEERHHSSSHLHSDFNLLDLIEEVVDKVCAGKGRTGVVNMDYFQYTDKDLQMALSNTIKLIDDITDVD